MPQRRLCLDDGANRRRRRLRRTRDELVRRGNRGHGVVEGRFRTVATAHIEYDSAHAAPDSNFRAHTVGPNPVDLAVFERLGRSHAEIDAGPERPRHRRDRDAVALQIDARLGQQPAQPHLDPGCGADAAALDHIDVAALGAELRIHDQKPVHTLRLGAEKLDALPLRKGR